MRTNNDVMRRSGHIWMFCLAALVATASTSTSTTAADRLINNLLGRWCGATTNYNFTRMRLTVTFHNGSTRRVLGIAKVGLVSDGINVTWNSGGNTIFGEFSANKQQMFQQANTYGDMGPRLEFHRC
jgi:hypothetical protein